MSYLGFCVAVRYKIINWCHHSLENSLYINCVPFGSLRYIGIPIICFSYRTYLSTVVDSIDIIQQWWQKKPTEKNMKRSTYFWTSRKSCQLLNHFVWVNIEFFSLLLHSEINKHLQFWLYLCHINNNIIMLFTHTNIEICNP